MTEERKEKPFLIALYVVLFMFAFSLLSLALFIPSIPKYAWIKIVSGATCAFLLGFVLSQGTGLTRGQRLLQGFAIGWLFCVILVNESIAQLAGRWTAIACELFGFILVFIVWVNYKRARTRIES